jgi:hypothetical protein
MLRRALTCLVSERDRLGLTRYGGNLERETVMESLNKVKFEPDMNGFVVATFEIKTDAATVRYPIRFLDQGATKANDRQALLELQKHLEQSLGLVRREQG